MDKSSQGTTEELVKSVEGKVWNSIIQPKQLLKYEKQSCIVNIKNEEDGNISIRYLSNTPYIPNSKSSDPKLEDLYLWLFPQDYTRKENF